MKSATEKRKQQAIANRVVKELRARDYAALVDAAVIEEFSDQIGGIETSWNIFTMRMESRFTWLAGTKPAFKKRVIAFIRGFSACEDTIPDWR